MTISAAGDVEEGQYAVFTVSVSTAISSDLTINYSVAQTGNYIADRSLGDQTVTVRGGRDSATLRFLTLENTVHEADGSVTVTVQAASNYIVGTPSAATVAIANDDPLPMVRVVYATPQGVDPNPVYMKAVEQAIQDVQIWYAEQLDGWTFDVQSPIPEHCTLGNTEDYYDRDGGYHRVIEDLQHCVPIWYETPAYVWAVYPDVGFICGASDLGKGGYGITILHRDDLEGLANPEGYESCGYYRPHMGWIGGLAHELGHALGLPHPPGCDEGLEDVCDYDAVMMLGFTKYPNAHFTEADIAFLMESPFIHKRLEVN